MTPALLRRVRPVVIDPPARATRPARQHGAVLLGFLVLLAASGWTVATWSQGAADERQRDDEQELLWIGAQYRSAIDAYYNSTPSGVKRLPLKLEELIEDKRFAKSRRHLRKVYGDPMLPGKPLKLIYQGQQISGVYSASTGVPFKRSDFGVGEEKFANAKTYADWRFVTSVRGPATAASGASAAGDAGSAPAGFNSPFNSNGGGPATGPGINPSTNPTLGGRPRPIGGFGSTP
ncbi:MAG: hypothetical protein AB9M60_17845 [Leptothrix sp. (in: b-proteobacteria)]